MHAAVPSTLLRPSNAARWVNCSGSHALEALYPETEDGPEAREGTAAHYYATEALQGRAVAVGALAPNGHPIDAAMVEHGQAWIDDVVTTLAGMPGAQFRVETRVFMHTLVHPLNEGTPDAWALNLAMRRLVLWDYKYGHAHVDPYQFWQGIDYVAGIFEGNSLSRDDVADLQVSIRVVQPRTFRPGGPVRTWETTGAHLWGLIDYMRGRALAALQPAAPTVTGPHCFNCKARHACEAFTKAAGLAMSVAGQTVPWDLPVDAVGRELSRLEMAADVIKARRDGLGAIALAAIKSGKTVDGWRMGYVDSRERWERPHAEVFALGDMLGVELRETEPPTPAQAKKKFKSAGLPEEVLALYYRKPTGAAKLVPVDRNAARKAFGG